jgi:hypothetical protein
VHGGEHCIVTGVPGFPDQRSGSIVTLPDPSPGEDPISSPCVERASHAAISLVYPLRVVELKSRGGSPPRGVMICTLPLVKILYTHRLEAKLVSMRANWQFSSSVQPSWLFWKKE